MLFGGESPIVDMMTALPLRGEDSTTGNETPACAQQEINETPGPCVCVCVSFKKGADNYWISPAATASGEKPHHVKHDDYTFTLFCVRVCTSIILSNKKRWAIAEA